MKLETAPSGVPVRLHSHYMAGVLLYKAINDELVVRQALNLRSLL